MSLIERTEGLAYESMDRVYEPDRVIVNVVDLGDGEYREVEYVPAEQLRGAVSRADDLRATVQDILDTGYHYAEEYRWSLQEALDADAKRGQ
jgi:hypothetical protein